MDNEKDPFLKKGLQLYGAKLILFSNLIGY